MGWPKAVRCLAYSRSRSRTARAGASATTAIDPLPGQPLHQVHEAAAELAQQVGRGHRHVVEEQLGGVRLGQADLVQLAAAVEAGHVALHRKQADRPARPRSGSVRATTMTRSALMPLVMNVLEPLRIHRHPSADGRGAERCQVGAPRGSVIAIAVSTRPCRIGAASGPSARRWPGRRGRGRPVGVDGRGSTPAALRPASSSPRTALKRKSPAPLPPYCLGHLEAEEALLAGLEPDAAVDGPTGDHLLVVGDDGAGHERLHGLAELVVVVVEEHPVHVVPSLGRRWALLGECTGTPPRFGARCPPAARRPPPRRPPPAARRPPPPAACARLSEHRWSIVGRTGRVGPRERCRT